MSLTLDLLLDTFQKYNAGIWPMQAVAYLLGLAALIVVIERKPTASTTIAVILAFLWLWTAIVFFVCYFGPAYPAAYGFAPLFAAQAILFLTNLRKSRLSFGYRGHTYAIAGILFIAYAMAGYPFVGYILGHRYPQSPSFGLTPCPLTVFTYGLFLLTSKKVPRQLLVIPLIWALGGFLPVSAGLFEDIGLIVAGVLGTTMVLLRDRRKGTDL